MFHDVEAAVVDDIAATLKDIREDYALEEPKTLIQTVAGAPYVEIIREAHERQADLVVVGMHRKRGQKDLLAGPRRCALSAAPLPCGGCFAAANPALAFDTGAGRFFPDRSS